ncbi:MAG: glycosyltransferase family 39 protein [Candidatus Acidiferrales bacterium]
MRESRGPWRSLWLMLLVAVALRLILVGFLYPETYKPRRDFWPFGYETGRIARSLASGEGFGNPLFEKTGPTAWMAPVFPIVLAGVFKVFGIYSKASALVILSLDSLFSALTCLPVFYAARECFGERAGYYAAWGWAVFPYAIFLSANFVWESCLTALLLTALFAWTLRLSRSENLGSWAGFGALWGLAALTSPAVLSVFPVMAGWACYQLDAKRKRWVAPGVICTLALLASLVPWTVRNYRSFHRLSPLRDNFWLEVWVGNNGDTSYWAPDSAHPSTSDTELAEYDRLGELDYMAKKKAQAIAFIGSHPGVFAATSFRRFLYTWTGFWSFAPGYLILEPMDPYNVVFCSGLTVLMLIGLRRAFQEAREMAILYTLVVVFFPVIYYFTHPAMNYRHVIDPEIVSLAVLALPRRLWAEEKVAQLW